MTIAFSICAYNYAALAFALFHSLKKYNPEIEFFLALVDTKENFVRLQQKAPEGLKLIHVNDDVVENFVELERRYTIIELNTAVKPYIFEYLFERNPECDNILFFDPDIIVFHSLNHELLPCFNEYDIILTPHVFVPDMQDKMAVRERAFLNTGIFNLGFLGLKRCDNTHAMLQWWKTRLKYWSYVNVYEGLFTDQIWINFVPLYFERVLSFKHWGANVAHWNLWERKIIRTQGKYFVNDQNHPLLFYHFSGFTNLEENVNGELPAYRVTEYNYSLQELAKELITDYQKNLISLGHKDFLATKKKKIKPGNALQRIFKKYFLSTIRKKGYELVKTMKYYKISESPKKI